MKKLKLKEISVDSFTTNLDKIRGGELSDEFSQCCVQHTFNLEAGCPGYSEVCTEWSYCPCPEVY